MFQCKYFPVFPVKDDDEVKEYKEYKCCPTDTVCTVHSETRWYCRLNSTVVSLEDNH